MARYFRVSKRPLEKTEQGKILRWLEEQGVYVFKTINANKAGVPDILCCVNGKFVALEVKRIGLEHNLTEAQKLNIENIKTAGGIAEVVSTLDDVKRLINNIYSQQEVS